MTKKNWRTWFLLPILDIHIHILTPTTSIEISQRYIFLYFRTCSEELILWRPIPIGHNAWLFAINPKTHQNPAKNTFCTSHQPWEEIWTFPHHFCFQLPLLIHARSSTSWPNVSKLRKLFWRIRKTPNEIPSTKCVSRIHQSREKQFEVSLPTLLSNPATLRISQRTQTTPKLWERIHNSKKCRHSLTSGSWWGRWWKPSEGAHPCKLLPFFAPIAKSSPAFPSCFKTLLQL